MLTMLALFSAGCGGISAGGSVSPAMFFMPGVMNTVPAPAATGAPMIASNPSQQLVQAR